MGPRRRIRRTRQMVCLHGRLRHPSSAPTAVAMMSSALFPSDPAPAPANPAFSPKSPPTDLGSRPSLMEQSKSIFCFFVSYFLLTHLLLMFQLIDENVWK